MNKVALYIGLVVCGVVALLFALRALEALLFGGLSSYNAGRITGSTLLAILFLLLTKKVLKKVRAS